MKIVQLVLRKLVKNENFDYVINDQPSPVINRKHFSRRPYGQIRHFSAGALGLLLGFLYDRMECPEHSDSIGKLLEPSELVL